MGQQEQAKMKVSTLMLTTAAQAESAWTNFELKNTMCVMRTGFANGVNQGIGNNAYTAVAFTTELYDVNGDFVSNTWLPPAGPISIRAAVTFTAGVEGGFTNDPVSPGSASGCTSYGDDPAREPLPRAVGRHPGAAMSA
jgi:hypothetical protein